jgi:hypothetical protein
MGWPGDVTALLVAWGEGDRAALRAHGSRVHGAEGLAKAFSAVNTSIQSPAATALVPEAHLKLD